MRFPWKYLVTSLIITFGLRPIFLDTTNYLIACFCISMIVGIANAMFGLGLDK